MQQYPGIVCIVVKYVSSHVSSSKQHPPHRILKARARKRQLPLAAQPSHASPRDLRKRQTHAASRVTRARKRPTRGGAFRPAGRIRPRCLLYPLARTSLCACAQKTYGISPDGVDTRGIDTTHARGRRRDKTPHAHDKHHKRAHTYTRDHSTPHETKSPRDKQGGMRRARGESRAAQAGARKQAMKSRAW